MTQERIKFATIALIFLIGLLPRIVILTSSQETVVQVIPDDAFYYFQTAIYIVAGQGSTFDGMHPTNGYHPLWMVLILPIATIINEPLLFTKVVLTVGILFNLLSSLLLYVILQRIAGIWWLSLIGTAIYYLDPQAVFSSLNGLETTISSLLFLISLYLVLFERVETAVVGYRYMMLTGVSLGLLLLARTDNIFYVAVFLAIVTFRDGKEWRWFKRGLVLTSTVGLVTAPWVLWNWFKFGSIIQVSGLALPYFYHQVFLLNGATPEQVLERNILEFLLFLQGHPKYLGFLLLGLALPILKRLVVKSYWRNLQPPDSGLIRLALLTVTLLWGGGILLILAHTSIRWYPRPWYFDQLIILSAMTFGLTFTVLGPLRKLGALIEHTTARYLPNHILLRYVLTIIFLVVACTLLAVSQLRFLSQRPYPHQVEFLDAADWLNTHLDERESVAAFNAGILAFFSGKPVVNLDGVINNAAYEAITNGELSRFIYKSSANYYVDYDPIMLERYDSFLGKMQGQLEMVSVQEIDRSGVDWEGDIIRIYRLDWIVSPISN